MLADILTMTEQHHGPIENIPLCFLGDSRSSIARQLLIIGSLPGMTSASGSPEAVAPQDVIDTTKARAVDSCARCAALVV
jgi:ornithine carbamoyltransferase